MARRKRIQSDYQTYGVTKSLYAYCKGLEALMKDEKKAPSDYAEVIQLARKVPVAKPDVKIIAKIPPDERKHYRWLEEIYENRCKRPFVMH